jgi:exopolysaccharide biosynthesis polyprenyl glycosylphosphotransferase
MVTSELESTKTLRITRSTRQLIITICLVVNDALFIGLALWGAYELRFQAFFYPNPIDPQRLFLLSAVAVPIWLAIFGFSGLYSTDVLFGGLEEYRRVFNGAAIGSVVLVLLDFMFRNNEPVSRGWTILSFLFATLLLEFSRFGFRRVVYSFRRRGHLLSPAILIGAGEEGHALYEQLKNWHTSGLYLVGFVDDRFPPGSKSTEGVPILGTLDDLEELVRSEDVTEVIVAAEGMTRDQLLRVYRAVSWNPHIKVRLSSGLFELLSTGMRVKELACVSLIELDKARITGFNALVKTIEDYALALFGLVVLSPFFLIIAILIRLDSPGPIFYRHRVLGIHEKPFDALKFRTMCQNSNEIMEAHPELKDQFVQNFKLKNDPRVTRLGTFLRRFSIDEFPQLINVLMGQMSLVGPRFVSPAELEKYGKWKMNLFTVKPGMTGQWQTSGRSDVSYDERVRLDMYYVRNWTVWLDIYLLFATIPAVITKKGAY